MPQTADGLISTALPAGEDFLDRLVAAMLAHCAEALEPVGAPLAPYCKAFGYNN